MKYHHCLVIFKRRRKIEDHEGLGFEFDEDEERERERRSSVVNCGLWQIADCSNSAT